MKSIIRKIYKEENKIFDNLMNNDVFVNYVPSLVDAGLQHELWLVYERIMVGIIEELNEQL